MFASQLYECSTVLPSRSRALTSPPCLSSDATTRRMAACPARTSCEPATIVFSDEGPHIFSRLYAHGTPVQADRFVLGKFLGFQGVRDGHRFIVLEKENGWPGDAVATVLADPALRDYKLVQDPWTMSIYDRTPIPPDRAAHLGCTPGR